MKFGIDDTLDVEYSGILHATKQAAKDELVTAEKRTQKHNEVLYSYIKEYDY